MSGDDDDRDPAWVVVEKLDQILIRLDLISELLAARRVMETTGPGTVTYQHIPDTGVDGMGGFPPADGGAK